MRTLALPFFVLFAACAAETVDADVGEDDPSIQGGKADKQPRHNFSVGIASKAGALCSGTLIAPNLVLTARHCVVASEGGATVTCADTFGATVAPSQIFVSTEWSLRGARKFYPAKSITTPEETSFCGNDIALITLKDNIPASSATPVTPVVRFPMTDRSRIGGRIAAMGYGITNPSAKDSGTRRLREGIAIVCVPGDTSYDCVKNGYGALMDSDREFITAGYVCSGDSGGGAFDQATFTRGTPYVVGVLSRGPQTDAQCLAAIYSRTDSHSDLILDVARKAAVLGTYAAPAWQQEDLQLALADAPAAEDPEPIPTFTKRPTASGCSASASSSTSSVFALAVLALTTAVSRRLRRR